MGILSSIFGGKNKTEEEKQKEQAAKNFDILKYDGVKAVHMRQFKYAVKCFNEALALQEDKEVYSFLSAAYLQLGETKEAKNSLEKLLAMDEADVNAWLSVAGISFMEEDYQAMETACQKVIALDGNNAMAYYLSAKASRGLKNDLQSVIMVSKALTAKEDFMEAYQLRAEILMSMGQAAEARKDVDKILTDIPENEDALLLKAEIDIMEKKTDEADITLQQVIAMNPFNQKAYTLRANILLAEKDFDNALALYNDAIELMPENAQLYQERGNVKLMKGDKEGSLADVKKAIEINPEKGNEISGNYDNFSNSTKGIY